MTDNCSKCKGRGYVDSPVVHLGFPGLCYQCDGAGTKEAQKAIRARNKKIKEDAARYHEVLEYCRKIAEENGGVDHYPPKERRWFKKTTDIFSTFEYAEKFGMTPKAAFIELCRFYCYYPSCDETGKVVGWSRV